MQSGRTHLWIVVLVLWAQHVSSSLNLNAANSTEAASILTLMASPSKPLFHQLADSGANTALQIGNLFLNTGFCYDDHILAGLRALKQKFIVRVHTVIGQLEVAYGICR